MKNILNSLFEGDKGSILALFCIMVWVMAALAAPCALKHYGENFFAVIMLIADIVNIPSLVVYLRIAKGEDKPGKTK